MARRLILYILAAGTVFFWGASFPLTSIALDYAGPMAVAFLRWAVAACVLLAFVLGRGKSGQVKDLLRRDLRSALWVGLTGITCFYALQNLALRYTSVVNAGVLANLTTVFMVLIGAWWLHERLEGIQWAAIGIAFVGAVLVSQGASRMALTGSSLLGDAMMILATLFAAIYSIAGKGLADRGHSPDVVTAVVAGVGALLLLPLALWEGLDLALPWAAWGSLLVLGAGSGALANLCWMYLLSRTEASRAAMALLLIPVISTALAVLLLHEPLPLVVLVGGALVVAGVALVEQDARARESRAAWTAPRADPE